jgi:uncharacterized protein (TIGR02145 family)
MNKIKIILLATITIFTTIFIMSVFAQIADDNNFTDSRDGQTYRTVNIGKLTWMAENLNFQTDSSWCYDDADSNCVKYGRLYTWEAAVKACPSGWRMPTDDEWVILIEEAGGYEGGADMRLKSKAGWNDCSGESGNGTDEFGFSALPGGYRNYNGTFYVAGIIGIWWSFYNSPTFRTVFCSNKKMLFLMNNSKNHGLSVRCVRDVDQ